jgi:hypothetical protein
MCVLGHNSNIKKKNMKKIVVTSLSLSLLSGCVTVNEEMLRKVSITPPQNNGGLLEFKTGELIQTLNGEGKNRGVLSGTTVLDSVGSGIMSRWKSKDIIADYGSPGELNREPDYTLTLSGVKDENGSIAAAVLSGLSLMLIPVSSTITYDLQFDLINNHTHKHYTTKAKNAVTSWSQILLLPALPFSWIGGNNMISDIADYAYDDLNKQGAFSQQ